MTQEDDDDDNDFYADLYDDDDDDEEDANEDADEDDEDAPPKRRFYRAPNLSQKVRFQPKDYSHLRLRYEGSGRGFEPSFHTLRRFAEEIGYEWEWEIEPKSATTNIIDVAERRHQLMLDLYDPELFLRMAANPEAFDPKAIEIQCYAVRHLERLFADWSYLQQEITYSALRSAAYMCSKINDRCRKMGIPLLPDDAFIFPSHYIYHDARPMLLRIEAEIYAILLKSSNAEHRREQKRASDRRRAEEKNAKRREKYAEGKGKSASSDTDELL